MLRRALAPALALALSLPPALDAQESAPNPPVVDSIALHIYNVFTPEQAERHWSFRLMNGLRFPTRRFVIENELLFQAGQPYDSALVAETARNLRALGIFREVSIDTLRDEERLIARVRTRDAWSTKPIIQVAFASDGTLTAKLGITERNVFGTGNLVHAAYRKEVDRDGLEFVGLARGIARSEIDAGGSYFSFSDGKLGTWFAADPWSSLADARSVSYSGEAAARRILRYRVISSSERDTTRFWRRAFVSRVGVGLAPVARPRRYVRLGAMVEIREEEYLRLQDTSLSVPDTLKAFVGIFGEYAHAKFQVHKYLNSFSEEDVDLTRRIGLSLNFAPSVLGYERTGIGPGIVLGAGGQVGAGFVHGSVSASGLFNSAGLDSGTVVLRATVAQKPGERHATLLHAFAGIQDDPAPGGEFDLGFQTPPRSWEPHSFVGSRSVWGTLEHRWFIWDEILHLFGLGVAAFVDYGGAWYGDQDARWGGNVGIGLISGSGLASATATTGRLDIGYRFGKGVVGSRWVLTFGKGMRFP